MMSTRKGNSTKRAVRSGKGNLMGRAIPSFLTEHAVIITRLARGGASFDG